MKKHQQWGIEKTYLVEKMGRRIGAAQKVKQMKATWAINYGKQKKKKRFSTAWRWYDDIYYFSTININKQFFLFYYFFPFKWLFGCTIHYTRPFKTTTYFSLYLLLLLINFARWLNIVYYWLTAIATKWHTFKCPKTRESTWTLVIMLLCSSIDFQRDKLPLRYYYI